MSLTDRSRDRVDERWDVSPDYYEATRRRVAAGENGGAGSWVAERPFPASE